MMGHPKDAGKAARLGYTLRDQRVRNGMPARGMAARQGTTERPNHGDRALIPLRALFI